MTFVQLLFLLLFLLLQRFLDGHFGASGGAAENQAHATQQTAAGRADPHGSAGGRKEKAFERAPMAVSGNDR